jgi:hypothetical protein
VERFFWPDAAGKSCMLVVAVGSSPRLNKDGVAERQTSGVDQQGDRRCEPVEEVLPAYRPDLTSAVEPR